MQFQEKLRKLRLRQNYGFLIRKSINSTSLCKRLSGLGAAFLEKLSL